MKKIILGVFLIALFGLVPVTNVFASSETGYVRSIRSDSSPYTATANVILSGGGCTWVFYGSDPEFNGKMALLSSAATAGKSVILMSQGSTCGSINPLTPTQDPLDYVTVWINY